MMPHAKDKPEEASLNGINYQPACAPAFTSKELAFTAEDAWSRMQDTMYSQAVQEALMDDA
jgi:hypothetical protein